MLHQVSEIRRKAAQSEMQVQEICRDIKRLDYAKKNLTITITGLRRLAMLITAVEQLQLAAERHDFKESGQLLGAVQQLAVHFKGYSHIPRIAELNGRVSTLEQSLRVASLREFELLGEDPPPPALLERLRDCCTVIAAAGSLARDELVDMVCRREMGVYTQIFGTIGETAKLERTLNRYKWLLRRLESRKDVWAIFPSDWRVPQLLCVTFCSITKTQLAEILDDRAAELPHQVENLLKAVEATHIFESEMARRFEGAMIGDKPDRQSDTDGENASSSYTDGMKDDIDAAKYRAAEVKWRDATERAEREVSPTRTERQQHAAAEAVARASFRGAISQVFIPYLRVYVDQVEREMTWSVEQIIRNESWTALAADQPVLRSSNELTDAVRGEMKTCAARVSRGKALLDLSRVFGRVYRSYAGLLLEHLPKTSGGNTSGRAILGAADWQLKLSDADIDTACLVVTTAEHCIEMLRQLAGALASRLEPPSLSDQVDYGDVEDEFRSLMTACLFILVLGVETKLESPLGGLMRHNWSGVATAGDQSEYVGVIRSTVTDFGMRVGSQLPSNHYIFFVDRMVRSFTPRLREAIYRCRNMSDAGCQQVRLDVEAIKGALVGLAKYSKAEDDDAAAYGIALAGDVATFVNPIEAALKVVSSPPEFLVDAFLELLPDAGPGELQRIADMKGLKRGELTAVLEEYARRDRSEQTSSAVRSVSSGRSPNLRAGPTSVAKVSTAAQDVASRFGLNANAARASAVAAGDSVRETTGRVFGKAMKNLRFAMQQ